MTNPNLWNQLLVWPITNLLIAFYKLCDVLHIPGQLGWAIILLTIAIRLLLYPIVHRQLKSAKKMSDLKPHLDALNEKHKNDKAALQQAQLALYKEHGVNPAEGCLTSLIQLPILFALYNVFYALLSSTNIQAFVGEINSILYFQFLHLTDLNLMFFGINLSVKPSQWQTYGWGLLAIPLITALLQWYQSKLMLPTSNPKSQITMTKNETGGKEPEKKKDDMAEMQKQMAFIMPIMFGFFALQFPVGLALYWNVFGLFGIIQQTKVNKGA